MQPVTNDKQIFFEQEDNLQKDGRDITILQPLQLDNYCESSEDLIKTEQQRQNSIKTNKHLLQFDISTDTGNLY